MQTCPGFFLKSLLESPENLLEICSVEFVDTLILHCFFFWIVFSFCSVSVFNLSFVLYFPA